MMRDSSKMWMPKVLGLGAVMIGGVAFAQGVSHMGPGTAGHPPAHAVPAPSQAQSVRDKLVKWFTAYDEIRRQAQMSPDERHRAHKLMSELLTNDQNDKQAGRILLSKMESRYVQASAQLKALPMLPQTADLQKGYEQYFQTGQRVFQKYLKALDSQNPQDLLLQAQQDKYQMGVLDITNKVLDKKLRKEYNIAPYKYD